LTGAADTSYPANTLPGAAVGRPARLILSLGSLWLAFAALALLALLATLHATAASIGAPGGEAAGDAVSALARKEIPVEYLHLYEQAAARYDLDWAILAGIGKVECDHGRDPAPSCVQEGVVNSAGAGGPMQFIASTWARYGVSAASSPEGEGDRPPDRWDPADAIYSAANYLRASGAPEDYHQAILAYNHAQWYVEEVESWAARYTAHPGEASTVGTAKQGEAEEGGEPQAAPAGADPGLAAQTSTPVRFITGERARLSPEDGHVALVPAGVPRVVQAMVVAGNELQGLPYGPAGHPDPLGAPQEDCSSTVNYILYRAGVRPLSEIVRENPLAQNYANWGAPGPGRWVTIYATDLPTPHVFIVIAGLRIDTSYQGTDEGPNRFEAGPRWRILDHIPTWADWSVRHPPGL
jgi:hypothetical protein